MSDENSIPSQLNPINHISTGVYSHHGHELQIDVQIASTRHGACLWAVMYDPSTRVIATQIQIPFSPEEARELAAQLAYAANLYQERPDADINPETGRQRIDVSGFGEPPGTRFVDGMNREEAERAAKTGYPHPYAQDGTE